MKSTGKKWFDIFRIINDYEAIKINKNTTNIS